MGKYSFIADVISILVLIFILYGNLFETKIKDKRRTALSLVVGWDMQQLC